MNTLLEAPSLDIEPLDPNCANAGRARKTDRISLHRGDSRPFRQEAGERMFDYRRAALERTHWRKMWRSALDD
jgi:hypothetical protein